MPRNFGFSKPAQRDPAPYIAFALAGIFSCLVILTVSIVWEVVQ